MTDESGWTGYLADFHVERPGITEAVLQRSRVRGTDPYDWLVEEVPTRTRVLDVACGNAPLWPRLRHRTHIGVDTSSAELAAARARGARGLCLASATALPVGDAMVDVVACAMALQLIDPLPEALAEVARVLVPNGQFVAILPASAPLHVLGWPAVAGLLAALRRPLRYPNDGYLRRLPELLAGAGLQLVTDQRDRFSYRLTDIGDAERFLASLYLPNLSPRRYQAARKWLRLLARAQLDVPIPIRRIVATRRHLGRLPALH